MSTPGGLARARRRELRAVGGRTAGGFLERAAASGGLEGGGLQGAVLVERGDASIADEHVSNTNVFGTS